MPLLSKKRSIIMVKEEQIFLSLVYDQFCKIFSKFMNVVVNPIILNSGQNMIFDYLKSKAWEAGNHHGGYVLLPKLKVP